MTSAADVATRDDDQWSGRLTPAEVNGVLFSRAGFGRRGYEETEVDVFLDRVQNELRRLITEKSELREEVARLKDRQRSAQDGQDAPRRDEASAQAVSILSAAQQTADQYVSDAEHYSRRISAEARERYEQLIEEARREAKEILDGVDRAAEQAASRVPTSGDEENRELLEQQVAYLQTFGQVCRVQLRSYLEALLRDIEEEWGRADPRAVPVRELAVGGTTSQVGAQQDGGAENRIDGSGDVVDVREAGEQPTPVPDRAGRNGG